VGLKPLWDSTRLTQKADWLDLFRSLNYKDKAEKILVAILTFMSVGHLVRTHNQTG
jgi:hypothetical protein